MPETFDVSVRGPIAHAVTWSFCAGKTYVTLAAKASLEIDRASEARVVAPEAVITRDAFVDRDPSKSVIAAVESAPYLPSAAVLMHATAHGSPGSRGEPFAVRLALFGKGPIIDKTLRVEDFDGRGVLLSYEHALKTADNPSGSERPSITDPRRPTEAVGFGPLSGMARARTQFLRGVPAPHFSEVLDLGREFDSRYWNPAPLDQQAPFLRGGETLVLEGLGEGARRVTLPLLGISATAEISPGRPQPLAMTADMLVIDETRGRLSIIWRAILQVPSDARVVRLTATLTGDPKALVIHESRIPGTTGEIVMQPVLGALPFRAPSNEPARLDQTAAPESRPKKSPTLPFDVPMPEGPRSAAPVIPATPFDPSFELRTPPPVTGDVTAPPWSQNDSIRASVARAAANETSNRAAPPPRLGGLVLGAPPLAPAPPAMVEAVVAAKAPVAAPAAVVPPPFAATLAPAVPPPVKIAIVSAPKHATEPVLDPGRALVLARIADGGSLVGASLVGADLHGLDLSRRSLLGANFEGAHLEGANFTGAKLARVSLVGANLEEASFIEADLEGALLTRAKLSRASFERAILVDADFVATTGDNARFVGARARKARFGGAHLTRAIFDDADLEEADLVKASLRGATFARARLCRALLTQVDVEKASFSTADLTGASLQRANLAEARFDDADATRASFDSACCVKTSFIGARMSESSFEKASLDEARFDRADLTGASLAQCAGPEARFAEATLEGANLRQAKLEGASFSKARMNGANLARADLSRALFDGADLTNVDARAARLGRARFDGAELEEADLRDADLTGATLSGANKATAKMKGAKLKDVVD